MKQATPCNIQREVFLQADCSIRQREITMADMFTPGMNYSITQPLFYTRLYLVSGFECTFPLFRTRRYKMVSPSPYATRIRTYGQSSSAACFDQHLDEKPKEKMKTKSNCGPYGSVMSADGFSE